MKLGLMAQRNLLRLVCRGLVLLLTPLLLGADGFRTWTDTRGRNVEAFLLSKTETHVLMLLRNGNTVPVERTLLSETCNQYVDAWTAPEFVEATMEEAVFALEGEHGSGSGFLMIVDDRPYLYTNQYVIATGIPDNIINARGETIELGQLEIHAHLDLARFSVFLPRRVWAQ